MRIDCFFVTSLIYTLSSCVGFTASKVGLSSVIPRNSTLIHNRERTMHVVTSPMTSVESMDDVESLDYMSDARGGEDDVTTKTTAKKKKSKKGKKGTNTNKKKTRRKKKNKKKSGKSTPGGEANEVDTVAMTTPGTAEYDGDDDDDEYFTPTSMFGMTSMDGKQGVVIETTRRDAASAEPTLTPTGIHHHHYYGNAAVGPVRTRNLSDEENLLQTLFSDYNPSARPVMNSTKTVMVSIQFSLMHIKDLNVISQVLTTTGLLIMEWTDERLVWTPRDHNNLTEIIIEAKGMWRPEFAVINGAEKIYEDYHQFRAVISHRGKVHWEPGGVFKTMCEIDITYYPFDEQRCELTFGAWSYHTSKMNLTNSSESINLDSYKTNGEWEIYNTVVQRNEFFYECCPKERFANVAFVIFLRRRHTFYVMNVILPSIMTSVLLLSVFFCTPGQKVQIGVVVLLSFRIFLLNVAGNIPKTSDHIPLLGIYLTCTMAITTLSMVLTVFVLNLHHVSDRPVPGWAKRLVFIYIARMLGMCSISEAHLQERRKKTQSRLNSLYRRPSGVMEGDGDERTAIIELHGRAANGTPETTTRPREQNAFTFTKPPPEEKTEDYGKDWKRMAEVFDRLFFWLFLLAILVSTLVLFHPLTNSYIHNER